MQNINQFKEKTALKFMVIHKPYVWKIEEFRIGGNVKNFGEGNWFIFEITPKGEELKKIENTIINSLFPEPEFNRYKDGLPKSDTPIDKESKRRASEIRLQFITTSTSL